MTTAATPGIGASTSSATFVYVSNADDGVISIYRMQDSGELVPVLRAKAASVVMPMAISPDRRFLYAVARSPPYSVLVYAIDRKTGELTLASTSPLPESLAYISLDRTGRFLLGASYGASLVTVNAVHPDGRVNAEPLQIIPVAHNAHSIRVDESNRFAYVPALGSDEMFMFTFDERTGRLTPNTPALCPSQPGSGPRHFVTSRDNRFVYVLNEMTGTVDTLALQSATGLLTHASSASALPPDCTLRPGAPRSDTSTRNVDNDIWLADIHLAPNGSFLYVSERTRSTLNALRVDEATGKLTYLSSTPTEAQPRGFAIDPKGRFLVATGERSATVSVYAIDAESGALALSGRYPTGRRGNWVEIVCFD